MLGTRSRGTPTALRVAVAEALDRKDAAALSFVLGPDNHLIPDLLVPWRDASLDEQLQQIASLDAGAVLAEIVDGGEAGDLPSVWKLVERRPDRWLDAYSRALARAAAAIEPALAGYVNRLAIEHHRVASLIATGAARDLLGTLHPASLLVGDSLLFERPGVEPTTWHLPPAGLVLVPMISSPRGLVTRHVEDTVTHIAYPLPESGRADASSELEALLGPQRAGLLRALDRPRTAGALATTLGVVPSVVTHHLTLLERAGLIARRREGRHVRAERTSRGTFLIALFAGR